MAEMVQLFLNHKADPNFLLHEAEQETSASSGRWPFKTQLSNGARGHPVSPMDSARN
jgi:hypothetical protein